MPERFAYSALASLIGRFSGSPKPDASGINCRNRFQPSSSIEEERPLLIHFGDEICDRFRSVGTKFAQESSNHQVF
jgi:hypothetical protein